MKAEQAAISTPQPEAAEQANRLFKDPPLCSIFIDFVLVGSLDYNG